MEESCYRCGAMGKLYDAIAGEGIVKICGRCQSKENLPIIRKVVPKFPPENETPLTVQQRLEKMSGVPFNPRAQREKMLAERKKREDALEAKRKQDEELKKIADKNFTEQLINSNPETDTSGNSSMVRNFHWVIMRARRARHLTRGELANMINEPEAAVAMAEKGVLPREREALVKKLQKVLSIQITKIPYDSYTKLPEGQGPNFEPREGENPEGSEEDEKKKRWTFGDLLKGRVKIKFTSDEDSEELEEGEEGSENEPEKGE